MRTAFTLLALAAIACGEPENTPRIDCTDADSFEASFAAVRSTLSESDRILFVAAFSVIARQDEVSYNYTRDLWARIDGLTAKELIERGLEIGRARGIETPEEFINWWRWVDLGERPKGWAQ